LAASSGAAFNGKRKTLTLSQRTPPEQHKRYASQLASLHVWTLWTFRISPEHHFSIFSSFSLILTEVDTADIIVANSNVNV